MNTRSPGLPRLAEAKRLRRKRVRWGINSVRPSLRDQKWPLALSQRKLSPSPFPL